PVTSTGTEPAFAGSKRSVAQTELPIRFKPIKRMAVRAVQRISSVVFPREYRTGPDDGRARYFHTKYPSETCAATNTTPMTTKVRANWWSIHGAEVETPCGSHQVFAAKKYVLKNVISQISTRIATAIHQTSGGSWDSHTAAQANLRMAQKFITFSIANFQMPIASWMLAPKIGKCRGALLCEPPCLCG